MSTFRTERARRLRQTQTFFEATFWQCVRGRRFRNLKFKRQRPFGRYVLDFFCEELNLVVELDGVGHLQQDAIDYDNERTAFLQSRGLTIVRIANDELRDNERGVFDQLERIIDGLQRLSRVATSPSPEGEGGARSAPGEESLEDLATHPRTPH